MRQEQPEDHNDTVPSRGVSPTSAAAAAGSHGEVPPLQERIAVVVIALWPAATVRSMQPRLLVLIRRSIVWDLWAARLASCYSCVCVALGVALLILAGSRQCHRPAADK